MGAIKIYRYQIAANMMSRHLKILTSPNRTVPVTYAGKRIDDEIVFSVIAFLTAYFTAFVFASVALSLTGLDLVTALSGAATALGNVGPGLGPIIGPTGNFAALPDVSKWILAIAMLLGRLELLAVLVLLHPDFWR